MVFSVFLCFCGNREEMSLAKPVRAEIAVFATLACVYIATLAPGVTLWDSGEFLSAIHSLGIPHPPGTPLYVLIGNVWAKMFSPVVGFAYSINLLSALCSAIACALMANLFVRWTGDRLAAYAAAVCAGATSSLWLSATETEVYSSGLLIGCLIFWIADRAGTTRERKWLILGAYVAGLGFALHLTALLTAPAAVYLAWSRKLLRNIPALLIAFIVCASAALAQTQSEKKQPGDSEHSTGRTVLPDDNKGQLQPQGWTGPITTGSGGAPAESPQGQSPPGMQAAPDGSSKTIVDPK